MSKHFTVIDHTADTGVQCVGETKEEVFEAAAEGMFSILTDLKSIAVKKHRTLNVQAETCDELLVMWLQELLFLFSTEQLLFSTFSVRIENITDNTFLLVGTCGGEQNDGNRHSINTEVKSVTYHQLTVQNLHDHWEAKVIFDI